MVEKIVPNFGMQIPSCTNPLPFIVSEATNKDLKKKLSYSNRLNRPSGDISSFAPSPLGFNNPTGINNANKSKIVEVKGSTVDFANITV